MTQDEIKRGIEMKANGAEYRKIAETLIHAAGEDDCLTITENEGCYPALSKHIKTVYGGNLTAFAKAAKVPNGTMHGVLYGKGASKATIDKILVASGMTYEEAFSTHKKLSEAGSSLCGKHKTAFFCYNGCPWENSGAPCPEHGRPERCAANRLYVDAYTDALEMEELHKQLAECASEIVALRTENEHLRKQIREKNRRQ